MIKKENNFAFIDGQNLYLAMKDVGWKLDLRKFRIYLAEKYSVKKAYYFLGFVEGNNDLYVSLQKWGYIIIFKPTLRGANGEILKGDCDVELVLQAMIDYGSYDKAVIVSGDGDFFSLVQYLRERGKLREVIAPNLNQYSGLLKNAAGNFLNFINKLREKLEYKKKSTP